MLRRMQSGKLRVREERARRRECWGFTVGSAQRECYALPPGVYGSYGELGRRLGRTRGALYGVRNWNA
jgi:hypothetical protein